MFPFLMPYFPLEWPFLLLLFAALSLLLLLLELKVLHYAYERMGIPPRAAVAILLLTLVGSAINLPLTRMAAPQATPHTTPHTAHRHHQTHYVVPKGHAASGTVLAVNVGGAVIPALLSLYLLFKNRLFFAGPMAILLVAAITHMLARPVHEVGITLPIFIPPIVAALCAMILSWRRAGPLAYIAGSMGTLIGADLSNLDKIPGLGAPIASIGGAGTFDAVFLVGVMAVLLASLVQPRPKTRRR